MNDFLHSLRTGNVKRYERGRKGHDNPQYRSSERGHQRDKKSGHHRKNTDAMAEIKSLLGAISDNTERARKAQERTAAAMERMADSLAALAPGGTGPSMEHQDGGAPETAGHGSREMVLDTIRQCRSEGMAFDAIARHLDSLDVPTLSGKGRWRAQNVSRLYNTHIAPSE